MSGQKENLWKTRAWAGKLWMVSLVLALVIVALVSERFWHHRFDFTEGQQYTLTPVTVEMLQNLDDRVSIRAVFSEDLPSRFAQLKTHVQDLLLEFESSSRGKLKVRFEDPGLDSAARENIRREGIQEIQVTEQNRDGAVAKRGFFGLVLSYGAKQEVIPLIQSLESFEYDLVIALRQLTGGRKKIVIVEGTGPDKVMFMDPTQASAQGVPAPRSGFAQIYPSLYRELQTLYDLDVWDGQSPITDEATMVLVAAPRKLSTQEQYYVDQFLMRGRNALIFAPSISIDFSRGINAYPSPPDYLSWLEHYGFQIQNNLVMDSRHGTAFFGNNNLFGTPYPYFPLVAEQDLNRDHAITSKLGRVTLPWTSSLILPVDSVQKDSGLIQTVHLLQSSAKAWTVEAPFNLAPQPQYLSTNQRQLDLAALRIGTFRSYFDSLPDSVEAQGRPHLKQSASPTGMLVVPNYLFASDFFVQWSSQGITGQNTVENWSFVLNAVDYLAQDPSLIQIRNREVMQRPISEKGFADRYFWIAVNLALVPLIWIVIGFIVLWRRRHGGVRS